MALPAMHIKHHKLPKPNLGHFGRREWAIIGTPCGNVQRWANQLSSALSPLRIGYADADHQADEGELPGFDVRYTDKIQFHRLDFTGLWNPWQARPLFHRCDLVLVNGNHFPAAKQLLALDRRKFDSIGRKLDRLTDVAAFLGWSGDPNFTTPDQLPENVLEKLPHWRDLPVFDMAEPEILAAWLRAQCEPPPLKALVLAGGKSTRMGTDKAQLVYHGKPQWQHLCDLLATLGIPTWVSCRPEQEEAFGTQPTIADAFFNLGPLGAILSAFQTDPNAAWLVLACDLPLMDLDTLRYLMDHRAPSSWATCFRQVSTPEGWDTGKAGDETGFPEPLIAIWEPKSYLTALQYLAQGASCPRKVLLNAEITLLDAPNPRVLLNVNTPAERAILRDEG